MNEITYLSDEELLQLIDAAEAELQSAPPDLAVSILAALEAGMQKAKPSGQVCGDERIFVLVPKSPRGKQAEFAAYCAKVLFTTAAAAAIVISLSLRPNSAPSHEDVLQCRQDTLTTMIGESYIFSKYVANKNTFGGITNETKQEEPLF